MERGRASTAAEVVLADVTREARAGVVTDDATLDQRGLLERACDACRRANVPIHMRPCVVADVLGVHRNTARRWLVALATSLATRDLPVPRRREHGTSRMTAAEDMLRAAAVAMRPLGGETLPARQARCQRVLADVCARCRRTGVAPRLQPAVVAELFGVHRNTARMWLATEDVRSRPKSPGSIDALPADGPTSTPVHDDVPGRVEIHVPRKLRCVCVAVGTDVIGADAAYARRIILQVSGAALAPSDLCALARVAACLAHAFVAAKRACDVELVFPPLVACESGVEYDHELAEALARRAMNALEPLQPFVFSIAAGDAYGTYWLQEAAAVATPPFGRQVHAVLYTSESTGAPIAIVSRAMVAAPRVDSIVLHSECNRDPTPQHINRVLAWLDSDLPARHVSVTSQYGTYGYVGPLLCRSVGVLARNLTRLTIAHVYIPTSGPERRDSFTARFDFACLERLDISARSDVVPTDFCALHAVVVAAFRAPTLARVAVRGDEHALATFASALRCAVPATLARPDNVTLERLSPTTWTESSVSLAGHGSATDFGHRITSTDLVAHVFAVPSAPPRRLKLVGGVWQWLAWLHARGK